MLPSVTAEDQAAALRKAAEVLTRGAAMRLGEVLGEVGGLLPGHQFASVRAGVEMAFVQIIWWSFRYHNYRYHTAKLASMYRKEGFKTLKLKVGIFLDGDIQVLQAIRMAHPDCLFILDANEGYTSEEAILVLQRLNGMEVTPILFEQPVHRDDWDGLGQVYRVARDKYGVAVVSLVNINEDINHRGSPI